MENGFAAEFLQRSDAMHPKKIVLILISALALTACAVSLREAGSPLLVSDSPADLPDPPAPSAPDAPDDAAPVFEPVGEQIEFPETEPPETEAETEPETEPPETEAETEPEAEPPETEATAEIAEPEKFWSGVDVRFGAIGDILVHPNIYMDAGYRGTPEKPYDFLPMFYDVAADFAAPDFLFVNQETVMAGEAYGYSGYPCFNCPQQLGLDLVSLGFNLVNIANNHMLDKLAAGLSDTIDFWNSQPVVLLGGYKNEEDGRTVRTVEKDGVTFAWLAYTLSTNGIVKSADSPLDIPYIDDARILSDLARAREAGDFVVVSIHWGDENTQEPNAEQRRLSRLIAEGGADLILGHHSHTLQPIEWVETERGPVLCVYSLGNFVSGMAYPVNMVGGIFNFRIVSNDAGRLEVADPVLNPTVFFYGMDWFNTRVYRLEDYTADIAAKHGVALSGYTLTPEAARQYVKNAIGEEFLPEWMK